jgi:hypothetical protein
MRTIINFLIFFILIVFCSSFILNGQETGVRAEEIKANRSIEQAERLAQVKAIRAKQTEVRNVFRETLTGNQLDILTNPALNREEKLSSFRRSLSGTQIHMMKANKKRIRTQNNSLRSVVSGRQRMQIRRMGVYRAQQNRFLYHRARKHNRFPRI